MSVHDHFSGGRVDMAPLASYLDGLDDAARVHDVRELSRREQAQLFEAAAGVRPVTLAGLVPADAPPLTEVIHHGRNSLPVFRIFEKRFCRPPSGLLELWGYNEHALRWLTGPGYFVARQHGPGEVLIDYLEVPPGKPDAWPPLRPNSAGGARFVYFQTQDVLRGVSEHACVGRAFKRARPMDNWFVLSRSGSK